MPISIIAIGKRHESWVEPGISRYSERLRGAWKIEWRILPHSTLAASRAREEESERILKALDNQQYVILLDETGKTLDSPALSRQIDQLFTTSRSIVFIIGGAYGVSDALKQRADLVWSLSSLVFPHQLVRLILIEQLYRAQQIALGGSYHHE